MVASQLAATASGSASASLPFFFSDIFLKRFAAITASIATFIFRYAVTSAYFGSVFARTCSKGVSPYSLSCEGEGWRRMS